MWIKGKEIRNILGLSPQALYERCKRGAMQRKKVNGLSYYWLENDPNKDEESSTNTLNVIYCRVSNTKQKLDLERQEKILTEYSISNGNKVDHIFKDIASGMNENRIEFNKMLKLIFDKKVKTIYVSYKDRLTRFGFQYFENIFSLFGTKIEVVNLTKEEDFQDELTQDLVSIIHHFSMKMYSNRRKQLKELQKQLNSTIDN